MIKQRTVVGKKGNNTPQSWSAPPGSLKNGMTAKCKSKVDAVFCNSETHSEHEQTINEQDRINQDIGQIDASL
jgi:hypothetical protein